MTARSIWRCALLCLVTGLPLAWAATDWSRFRGPNGSGVSEETGIPVEFGPEQSVVWKTPLPEGLSSPVFGKDSIFVTGFEGDNLYTIAMDRQTGKIRWRRTLVRERRGELREPNNPASPSPVTDGENVYVFFQDFGLASYGPDGNERWRLPLGPFNNPMGLGASPILAGDKLIQVCDSETDSFIVALDKDSGKTVWRKERPVVTRGFSTPVLYEPKEGGLQVLVPGSYELVAYSAADGERVWWVRSLTWQLKPTPVMDKDTIYVLGWAGNADAGQQEEVPPFAEVIAQYDADKDGKLSPQEAVGPLGERAEKDWDSNDLDRDGFIGKRDWEMYQTRRSVVNSMQAIRLGGRGDMTATAVKWQYHKSLPNVPSPLLYDGVIYLVKDGGIVTALDAAGGTVLKQGRLREAMDKYYASPVAADGKIFMVSELGVVSVLEPGADWRVIQVNRMDDESHATPVILDGKIYLRTKSALYCFGNGGDS